MTESERSCITLDGPKWWTKRWWLSAFAPKTFHFSTDCWLLRFRPLEGPSISATKSVSESEAEKIDILGMVISVFHLPNMGGEKITLSISVLLALTFFLNLVSGLTPRNGVFSSDYLVLTLKSLAWRFTCFIKEHE